MLSQKQKINFKIMLVLVFGVSLWFVPSPEGLDIRAWRLFIIFITAILSIITDAAPVLSTSLLALSVAMIAKCIDTKTAFSGFSQDFVILILMAFLISKAVIKAGFGKRLALYMVKFFGDKTLKLAYSLSFTDMVIAPFIPSNTARACVLYPVVHSLASNLSKKTSNGTGNFVGKYLMLNTISSLSISSSLWPTAMAANILGIKLAQNFGVNISLGQWILYSSVPSICAFIALPFIIYKFFPPMIEDSHQAQKKASLELKKMGHFSRNEKIVSFIFIFLFLLWSFSSTLQISLIAISFIGFSLLTLFKVFTIEDLKSQGNILGVFIWFSIFFTFCNYLNHYGFMKYLSNNFFHHIIGPNPQIIFVSLIILYVLIHYFFVSQTAQLLTLFSVFLSIGIKANISPVLMSMMLLLATNFSSAITPQASSANIIFMGSGHLENKEVYKIGGIITLCNTFIYLFIGSIWIHFLTSR